MRMIPDPRRRSRRAARSCWLPLLICALGAIGTRAAEPTASPKSAQFRKEVQPLLAKYCSDCHADGADKGNVAFDQHPSDDALVADPDLWFKVLKNVLGGVLPPSKKHQPAPAEKIALSNWVKYAA